MSNPHLDQAASTWGASLDTAPLAALAVHGRNQDPEYMAGVLGRIDEPRIGYVLPRAAERTWYPAPFTEPLDRNEPRLSQALQMCGTQLDRLAARGFPAERTVLLGFSQGACLLSEFMLRNPRRYAGAVLFTGGYIGPDDARPAQEGSFAGTPVYLGTSRHDAWVPLARAEATAALLRAMHADVTSRVYDDTEHHVNDDATAEARTLLRQVLD